LVLAFGGSNPSALAIHEYRKNIMLKTIFIGIFIAVAAGLILFYIFGIGKPKTSAKSTGVMNRGKNTIIENNEITGYDVAVDGQGHVTKVKGNQFKRK
jgi:hypothetical protein